MKLALVLMLGLISTSTVFADQGEIGKCKPEFGSATIQGLIKTRAGIDAGVGLRLQKLTPKDELQLFTEKVFGPIHDIHGVPTFYMVNFGFKVKDKEVTASCESTYRYWQTGPAECSNRFIMSCAYDAFKDKATGKTISSDSIDRIGFDYQMKNGRTQEYASKNGTISRILSIWKTPIPAQAAKK